MLEHRTKSLQGDVVITSARHAQVIGANLWNYSGPGNVTSISPSSGQIGTLVTIKGTGLLASATKVVGATLAGVDVSSVVTSTDTEVVVKADRGTGGAAGSVRLVVTSDAVVTDKVGGFTYITEGPVDKLEPSSGQKGTLVTIKGQTLLGGGATLASVEVGGIAWSVAKDAPAPSDSAIVVVAESGGNFAGDGRYGRCGACAWKARK